MTKILMHHLGGILVRS